MAQDVWSQLQTTGQVDSELVAINFESLTMRTEMDWDTFAQGMDLLYHYNTHCYKNVSGYPKGVRVL